MIEYTIKLNSISLAEGTAHIKLKPVNESRCGPIETDFHFTEEAIQEALALDTTEKKLDRLREEIVKSNSAFQAYWVRQKDHADSSLDKDLNACVGRTFHAVTTEEIETVMAESVVAVEPVPVPTVEVE